MMLEDAVVLEGLEVPLFLWHCVLKCENLD